MTWTDERTELACTLYREGYSASQIALRLGGVTRNAVIGKVHRAGLRKSGSSSKHGPSERRTRSRRGVPSRSVTRGEAPTPGIPSLPAQPFLPPQEPPPDGWLTLAEMPSDGCRYPQGEGSEIRFCPSKRDPGCGHGSYCSYHFELSVNRGYVPWGYR